MSAGSPAETSTVHSQMHAPAKISPRAVLEPPLEQRDQLADPDNGVRQPMRVAHDKIDAEADQKGEKGPFQGVFPPFCSVKM